MFNFLKGKRAKTEQALKRSKDTWFSKITGLFDRPTIAEELWEELEELLIAADVGVDTTARLIQQVRSRAEKDKLSDPDKVRDVLKENMATMLHIEDGAVEATGQLEVILTVGVNGSGKTTTIAKLAYAFKKDGKEVILAAADTFRAAAIEQLRWWGKEVGAEVVAHQPGADPGAVVFDALQAARHRGVSAVIIDTAGRLHTKFNLMEELKKVKRVAQRVDAAFPQETLLVIDASTGQNGLSQAKHFTEAVDVSGIVLTKLDGTSKGGIVLAICDQLNIPVKFIGTGEKLDDLAPFEPQVFVEAIMS
ncbi:MAG: signal recognition particle-docking protein FtsY [Chloroflexi bacterium]|nr:MAG: signal recognition particle-docking protein FtsY [Chloroflexota bacterium]